MGQRTMKFLWDKLAQWKVCGWLVPGAVMGLVGEVENKGATFSYPSSTLFSFTYQRQDRSGGDGLFYFWPYHFPCWFPGKQREQSVVVTDACTEDLKNSEMLNLFGGQDIFENDESSGSQPPCGPPNILALCVPLSHRLEPSCVDNGILSK